MKGLPRSGGLMRILIAKGACCGLLLVALGVISVNTIITWLRGGGLVWLGVAAALVGIAFHVWRRRPTRKVVEGGRADLSRRPASNRIP